MPAQLLTGPLLGLESDTLYTLCFTTTKNVSQASVNVSGKNIAATAEGDTYASRFWRAEITIAPDNQAKNVSYSVMVNGAPASNRNQQSAWTFHVPARDTKPRMMYASCNGFSSADLVNKTEHPYALWEKLKADHAQAPYSLMILGGDQLYADEMWSTVPALKEWSKRKLSDKKNRATNKVMLQQIDKFFDELYQQRWSDPCMVEMLASIPSIMMWDDHDIFDGWGSYPVDLQQSPVFQAIFSTAKLYFELLQIRSRKNTSLLNPNAKHYAFALQFRGYHILALDNRAERTLTQVMSPQQWQDMLTYMDTKITKGDVLLLSAVPVVYRDFSFTETTLDATPWEEELTDDLKDHWRAKEHQGERARLIMRVLDNIGKRQLQGNCRTVILSGDVHIGCLGVVNDRRTAQSRKIHQVVSSGIVHPAPSRIAWYGIMAVTNDKTEHLNEDKSIEINMLKPYSSDQYLRVRNYVSLQEGTDKKLWLNWMCESKDKPVYPLD